ncbi:transposase [Arachidicoccus soli]|uniref:Tc1-like transposase DDE domain-containing protein n=1 Tax=Arachidicoccus soli TaxID=2341117 RepID=A0A386HQE1_9BACT|nr:hypothetical protein D6B99_09920 [Arachidicoccus soli]
MSCPDELAKNDTDEYKILILDNGAFHKAKSLIIPHNIKLFFLPPYSPGLNSAEKIGQHIKRKFTDRYFKDLHQMSEFFTHTLQILCFPMIQSICPFKYIA